MSTTIRPEISNAKEYFIPKHRYYELKHFCLQYKDFKMLYESIVDGIVKPVLPEKDPIQTSDISDITAIMAMDKAILKNKIEMIEQSAYEADPIIAKFLIEAVSEGKSYDILAANYFLPCSRDTYYNSYRKFFIF